MTQWPAHWNTPGDVSVPERCHDGVAASAVEPYGFPDSVRQPPVGDEDVRTPRLLPHVVPVVNVYQVAPSRTRSGSGASSANAGAAAADTAGAVGGADAPAGIHAPPNPNTSPPRSSIQ